MNVALKIDVDTHQGLKQGVPRLAAVLEREKVAATFLISMGPDNSGKAIRRAFRNRGFVAKMFRTRATKMYGFRTILSGTLLPARPIALAFPGLLLDLEKRGFEVGVHGYDHVNWQDNIDSLGESGIRAELDDCFEVYRAIFRRDAASFAAPGWRVNHAALELLDQRGLKYVSNTRGRTPFRCRLGDRVLMTPEIPSTLPTLDEVMGRPELRDAKNLTDFFISRCDESALNVHTIHAETEGMGQFEIFMDLVGALKKRGATFVRLDEVAARLKGTELPVCEVTRTELEGRAGWVAGQGTGPPS